MMGDLSKPEALGMDAYQNALLLLNQGYEERVAKLYHEIPHPGQPTGFRPTPPAALRPRLEQALDQYQQNLTGVMSRYDGLIRDHMHDARMEALRQLRDRAQYDQQARADMQTLYDIEGAMRKVTPTGGFAGASTSGDIRLKLQRVSANNLRLVEIALHGAAYEIVEHTHLNVHAGSQEPTNVSIRNMVQMLSSKNAPGNELAVSRSNALRHALGVALDIHERTRAADFQAKRFDAQEGTYSGPDTYPNNPKAPVTDTISGYPTQVILGFENGNLPYRQTRVVSSNAAAAAAGNVDRVAWEQLNTVVANNYTPDVRRELTKAILSSVSSQELRMLMVYCLPSGTQAPRVTITPYPPAQPGGGASGSGQQHNLPSTGQPGLQTPRKQP
jgi:hypothetical protein